MISSADLPETIALFPLTGFLLLPRGRMSLHVYEPRYLEMVDAALKKSHRMIGTIQPVPTGRNLGGEAGVDTAPNTTKNSGTSDHKPLHEVGCAGRISSFTETAEGGYMITLTGVSRFKTVTTDQSQTPFIIAQIAWRDFAADLGKPEHDPQLDRDHFISFVYRYFALNELETDWDNLQASGDELMINSLSMLCPFSPEDKQALLEAPSLATRRKILTTLMEYDLRKVAGEEKMQ
jgi:Lon protease-like protein